MSCWVEAAILKVQVLGQEPTEVKNSTGSVIFNGYTKKPLSHQVSNIDSKPFHVVGFEIMYPEPGQFSPSTRAEVAEYKLVLDNERVRAWRLMLEPGESVAAVTQKAPGIGIVISPGAIVQGEPGGPEQDMDLKLGEFIWQEANQTRSVRNSGTTRVEIVEYELK